MAGSLLFLGACFISLGSFAEAQDVDSWRIPFASGEEARRLGDITGYALKMSAAAELIPQSHPSRPLVQYHAARAAALDGRQSDAVNWLRAVWDEGLQSLMISFAQEDHAFANITGAESFRSLIGLVGEMELTTRWLGGDVHLINGVGSNVLVKVSTGGVLMVDTGYGPALPALRCAINELGGGPIRAIIITHPHEDHMGSAADLGGEADLYAHIGTADAMMEPYFFMEGLSIPPKPASAIPDMPIDEAVSIEFGGETIRILPTVAHSSGDISVYFTESRVAHLGDTFLPSNPMMYPGTVDPDAFLERLEKFLDGMHPETVVVPGHEGVTGLKAVREQIRVTREAIAFVSDAISSGMSIEETARAGQDRFPFQWTTFFYQVLMQLEL
tara:strand:+ start:374 stop:1534 length:1161 start_codon:yes stop_codon:yes gene_type:complete